MPPGYPITVEILSHSLKDKFLGYNDLLLFVVALIAAPPTTATRCVSLVVLVAESIGNTTH
jgi:hypothetical protein